MQMKRRWVYVLMATYLSTAVFSKILQDVLADFKQYFQLIRRMMKILLVRLRIIILVDMSINSKVVISFT